MSESSKVSALELAALMCSRVCHDVISPVGAIMNGLEVLADDDDAEMRAHAMDLITKSAAQASAKLQFARLCFGAAGSAGTKLDLQDAREVTEGFMQGERAVLDWQAPPAVLDKEYVKLLLNMVLIGMAAIPRGGQLSVFVDGDMLKPQLRIRAEGQAARIPAEAAKFIGGLQPDDLLDARAVQPYFTGLVARSLGLSTDMTLDGEVFQIEAGFVDIANGV